MLEEPVPRAFIEELNRETCEFSLTFWIRDSRRKREVVDQVYRRISERLPEESIWAEKQFEVEERKGT